MASTKCKVLPFDPLRFGYPTLPEHWVGLDGPLDGYAPKPRPDGIIPWDAERRVLRKPIRLDEWGKADQGRVRRPDNS